MDKSKTQKFNLRLEQDEWEDIERYSVAHNMPKAEVIRMALRVFFHQLETPVTEEWSL